MVRMQAVQSALAVRRQRTRQEEAKRAKQRRESSASVMSTPRDSVVTLDGHVYFDHKKENKSSFGHVTMFHVGGVLILIGLMLVITSLMPSYVNSTTPQKRNDLLGTGSFFVILGGVLTTISRFVSNHEDEELNQYIKGRLYRTRSGHLLKDTEACLSPHKEKHKTSHNGVQSPPMPSHSSSSTLPEPEVHSFKNGHVNSSREGSSQQQNDKNSHDNSSSRNEEGSTDAVDSGMLTHSASSEPVLSRILEEDEEYDGDASTEPLESSLSMCSSLETQALLEKPHSVRSGSKSSIKSSCKSIKIV